MRRSLPAMLCVALALMVATLVHACPTSLIWIPCTDIQESHSLCLGLSHYRPADPDDYFTDLYATYGVSDRVEVGLDWLLDEPHPLSFNAKALLLQDDAHHPALAVGLMGFGTRRDMTDYNIAYLLLAQTFGRARVTAGYGRGNRGALGVDPDILLLGLDGYLDRAEQWWWCVDYESGKNSWGALSFGVSHPVGARGSLTVGFNRYNDRTLGDTLYLGAGWKIGGKGK